MYNHKFNIGGTHFYSEVNMEPYIFMNNIISSIVSLGPMWILTKQIETHKIVKPGIDLLFNISTSSWWIFL